MFMADGRLANENTGRCSLSFKKNRKINRAKTLLNSINIKYKEGEYKGITTLTYYSNLTNKRLSSLMLASARQLQIICDELRYWDSELKTRIFWSKFKEDANFAQYTFAASGIRSTISFDQRDGKECYRVIPSRIGVDSMVGMSGVPKTNMSIVKSIDGKKYCFTTSTGFWLMRRNYNICVTGNCGMRFSRSSVSLMPGQGASSIKNSLVEAKEIIESRVPTGFHTNQTIKKHIFDIDSCFDQLSGYSDIFSKNYKKKVERSIGTLGGGK